ARKKKGISIREAAEATKIRGDYLQKFESNHFDIGLTEIYTRGFLRTYANFLKVPADRLLNDYAALGRGEARPRSPNREVYGRMDISVATAGESSDRATPPGEEPATPEAPRPQPRFPRGASSLPLGPDPALIFKYIKWAVIAAAAVFLLLLAKSFLSGKKEAAVTPVRPSTTAIAGARTITLVAAEGPVHVQVWRAINDGKEYGEVIFEGDLARGQTKVIPRPGDLFISADPNENFAFESGGKRFTMKKLGAGSRIGQWPATAP
ncbi:MAG: helix-turn-helix domain-containing protein, partial [Opitutaceae bacterium]